MRLEGVSYRARAGGRGLHGGAGHGYQLPGDGGGALGGVEVTGESCKVKVRQGLKDPDCSPLNSLPPPHTWC